MTKSGNFQFSLIAALIAQVIWVGSANATGALAVGVAPGGAQHGFSYGVVWDASTAATAQTTAMSKCQTSKESNPPAQARCTLVGTFTNQCSAIAMDPATGTPGIGWAIAADTAAANKQALANCEATAGPGRTGFCRVSSIHCDGSGK
jgi:hypothetical protein